MTIFAARLRRFALVPAVLLAACAAEIGGNGIPGNGGNGDGGDPNSLGHHDGGNNNNGNGDGSTVQNLDRDGGNGQECSNPLNLQGCGCPTAGMTRACYTGPADTENIGTCKDGTQTCIAMGEFSNWGPCAGDVLPTTEDCAGARDTNCNNLKGCDDLMCAGMLGCCKPGAIRSCYDGPVATENVSGCSPGMQTCDASGAWPSACTGETLPSAEAGHCTDGIDNDCNGNTDCKDAACVNDPACIPPECSPGAMRNCYDGPANTEGKGICLGGTQTCSAQGKWPTACAGEVKPGTEFGHCTDGIDNDCNGNIDCKDIACILDPACAPPVCTANSTRSCYSGPGGTAGKGICHAGTQTCASNGSGWGNCMGQVTPGSEAGNCSDGIDNDCNGLIDCADPACAGKGTCCVPTTGIDSTIYATSADTLYVINHNTWTESAVGTYGVSDKMTDIAMTPNGSLFTISSTALYSVNVNTAKATLFVHLPGSLNNGLTFLPDGSLLASDASGTLKQIDPNTGNITIIGDYGLGYGSSGDLVAVANGTMYGVSATDEFGSDVSSNNILITVDVNTGEATEIGYIGFANVFGLAYYGGTILGLDYLGDIIRIDPNSGAGTKVGSNSSHFFGGATSPLIPGNGCP